MTVMEWVLVIYNGFVALVYGYDKLKSKGQGRRVPERTLLLFGFFFGAVGALFGMELFRHKTKHRRFWVYNTLFFILQAGLLGFYFFRS